MIVFGTGALVLWGEAARTGLVQPGEQLALGAPDKQQPPVPTGRLLRRCSWALHSGGRTTNNRPKVKERRLCLDIRKNCFTARTISSGAVCLVSLCRLHPWSLSKTKWIKP